MSLVYHPPGTISMRIQGIGTPEYVGSFLNQSSRSQGGVQALLRTIRSRLRAGIVAVGRYLNRGSSQCELIVDRRGMRILNSHQPERF